MPVLLAENVVKLEYGDLWARRPIARPDRPLARAAGHHQSALLAHVARKVGWLKPDERDESEYTLIWALGQAVEEFTFSLHPDYLWQPGERMVDGIAMNCDGLSFDQQYGQRHLTQPYGLQCYNMLQECKATYKSEPAAGDFLLDPKWKMYEHQGREYCYGYEVRVVQYTVWHLRGNYKEFGPSLKQYVVGYSDLECTQTHKLLMRYKAEVEPEGVTA
jgi:hypothetical protein